MFKIGDKVKTTSGWMDYLVKDKVYTVKDVTSCTIKIENIWYYPENFELFTKTRPHAELIKAWADGTEIQFQVPGEEWKNTPNPTWSSHINYRIKPKNVIVEKQYHIYHIGTSEIKIYNNTTFVDGKLVSNEVTDVKVKNAALV